MSLLSYLQIVSEKRQLSDQVNSDEELWLVNSPVSNSSFGTCTSQVQIKDESPGSWLRAALSHSRVNWRDVRRRLRRYLQRGAALPQVPLLLHSADTFNTEQIFFFKKTKHLEWSVLRCAFFENPWLVLKRKTQIVPNKLAICVFCTAWRRDDERKYEIK